MTCQPNSSDDLAKAFTRFRSLLPLSDLGDWTCDWWSQTCTDLSKALAIWEREYLKLHGSVSEICTDLVVLLEDPSWDHVAVTRSELTEPCKL